MKAQIPEFGSLAIKDATVTTLESLKIVLLSIQSWQKCSEDCMKILLGSNRNKATLTKNTMVQAYYWEILDKNVTTFMHFLTKFSKLSQAKKLRKNG